MDDARVVEPLTPPPDELEPLLDRVRGGDRRATEELLRQSYDRVYPVCRRMLGNDTDAADAAQEALISVAKGLPRFDGRSRFTTWVYRIAVNASIDELRRRARRKVVPFPAASSSAASTASAVMGAGLAPGASSWSAAEPVFRGEGPEDVVGMLDVEAALVAVPLDYRAAVVLRDVCGLDYAEIAEVLGIPGGTVRSRIARGRGLLADRLRPDPEDGA